MKNIVQIGDIVDILPNSFFPGVVGQRGKVIQVYAGNTAIVHLDKRISYTDLREPQESYNSSIWVFMQKHLGVIESPLDNRIGELEYMLEESEENLSFSRATLAYSEELRENQSFLIDDLQQQILALERQIKNLKFIKE